MLDLKMLNDMPPSTIFATGTVNDNRLHREYTLRWVAVRGGRNDWAIYYHKIEKDIDFIRNEGDKCFTKEVIKELVPCDDEAFLLYRY